MVRAPVNGSPKLRGKLLRPCGDEKGQDSGLAGSWKRRQAASARGYRVLTAQGPLKGRGAGIKGQMGMASERFQLLPSKVGSPGRDTRRRPSPWEM